MKASDMYPSAFLKADDLQGKRVRLTIASVAMEKMGEDTKPVASFQKTEKKLVLNRTKVSFLAELFGDESAGWIGKTVVLAPGRTQYQGKMVPCINIESAPALKSKEPEPPPDLREPGDDFGDAPF